MTGTDPGGGAGERGPLPAWLALAPLPRARPEGCEWDVFISYRSHDRAWALALYDLVTSIGYRVFLDQFVLPAGSTLRDELRRALAASASGVLLWSQHVATSSWVKSERNAFHGLRDERHGSDHPFHFVLANLDGTPPEIFDRDDIWVDFGDCRHGPDGSGLLRLLFGLAGEPLSQEAVRAVAALDADVRDVLASVEAARRDDDRELLRQLGAGGRPATHELPAVLGAVAEALIAVKDLDGALDVIRLAQRRFPHAVRPAQLEALVHRRRGAWREATRILGKLHALGHRDPETLGIYGAAFKQRAVSEPEAREAHLQRARDLYVEGFRGDPSSHYCAVNAATLSLTLRDAAEARRYAEAIVTLLAGKEPPDQWAPASLGDAHVILGDDAAAESAYAEYAAAVGQADGDLDTTASQLRDLLAPALGMDDARLARLLRALRRE